MTHSIPIFTIISAAALDSINPCAIGVLVFLITFLVSIKGSRKKILRLGFTYVLIVYLSYLAAGLGLLKILERINPYIETIYKGAGVILIIAGLVDVRDGLIESKSPLLSIPKQASPYIKKYISKATIPAAIILGLLVSLVELPCTGGVYIAILSMISRNNLHDKGILYLTVYNFVFVLPLIIILLLFGFGLTSQRVDSWRKRNRSTLRLMLGLGMIVLGILILGNFL